MPTQECRRNSQLAHYGNVTICNMAVFLSNTSMYQAEVVRVVCTPLYDILNSYLQMVSVGSLLQRFNNLEGGGTRSLEWTASQIWFSEWFLYTNIVTFSDRCTWNLNSFRGRFAQEHSRRQRYRWIVLLIDRAFWACKWRVPMYGAILLAWLLHFFVGSGILFC